MLRTKNWGREKKIGDVIVWWTLAEALNWRRKHNPHISIDKAFEELRTVCSPKHAKDGEQWLVWASGRKTGWSPILGWRSGKLPPYRPFEDPPTHDPQADLILADEWPNLALSSADEIADGKLDYACERTPAWQDVRFPRDELIVVWLSLIAEGTQAAPAAPSDPAIGQEAAGRAADQPGGQNTPQGPGQASRPPRTRGRPPDKRLATEAAMKEKIANKTLTPNALDSLKQVSLETEYGVNRETAGQARDNVLKEHPVTGKQFPGN